MVSAADGSPLKSARVGLVQADTHDHPQVYGNTTDNEGHFEVKKVVAGRYRFFASHIGYLEQAYQAKDTESGQGAVLSLISGREVTDVLLRLVHAGVIAGKVVDDTGEPMIGVTVKCCTSRARRNLKTLARGPRRSK